MGTGRELRRHRVDLIPKELAGCVIKVAEEHEIVERADGVSQ